MTAQDDSDPAGRRASRRESAADDALAVARFCWPDLADSEKFGSSALPHRARMLEEPRNHTLIAAAEAVLVERGLGEEYGRELLDALGFWRGINTLNHGDLAAIRTAPLDVCLRAMAAVVRKQQRAKR